MMINQNLDYCSLYFLRQWLQSEKSIHDALHSNEDSVIHKGLEDAVKFFGVARNLPNKYDTELGLPRYKPLLDAFFQVNNLDVSSDNYLEVLTKFQEVLSETYGGKSLISLSSKLLWLRYKDPFIIYDSKVRSSLRVPSGEYECYTIAWLDLYTRYKSEIEESCARLPGIHRYVAFNLSDDEMEEITTVYSELWFHKRVFDMYLWHQAGLGA